MAITARGTRGFLSRTAARLTRPDGNGRGSLAAYGALAAADLLATATRPRSAARAAKPLLMPALAVHVVRRQACRDDVLAEPVPRPLLFGLACATVGDTALLFDKREPAFLLGMAAFLGTQTAYTAGFARMGALRGIAANPRPALGCLGVWVAANAVIQPSLDRGLRLPVAGYSLALVAMGATALAVGGKVGAGAMSFLGSDALIGLKAAGHEFPSQEVLIMAGYLLGQYLIATGWLERQ
ncbi:lysoplasmalogenase [Streptomyces sp. XM4193]|uniref:lysoplasmalogenase n=1 Tax=Streptomyces sp. XM4193 TaxID=2929782 RepID=UPI001FF9EE56|nr:lysoplasmalogenase [Streptomyces sp. XM4193]MCK1796913.1 lysoplasmalogenase [Streptomyces sp. XM4193]